MKIKMNKKTLVIPILLVSLAVLGMSISSVNMPSTSVESSDGVKYSGTVCVYKNNELVECKHNLLTTWGKNGVKAALSNGTVINATNISIANNTETQVVGDKILQGQYNGTMCGGSLGPTANVLYWSAGDGQWNISYQWTSSCDGAVVNATGLSNSTNELLNRLFAETTFTSVTLQTNDKLNVTWGIIVS